MNLIGTMIKKGLEWKAFLSQQDRDPWQEQQEQLKYILRTARHTALGKYYHFEGLLESSNPLKAFQRRLPLSDYDTMYQRWWHQGLRYPDIFWPGHPPYFARSSGTTGGAPKRIPVTESMLEAIRSVSVAQLTSISHFDMPEAFFEREMLALSSHTQLEKTGPHREGEISAITAANIPSWFENVYRPGPDIARIADWDQRIERIAEEAPQWDIGVLNGIPSWVLLMLRRIIEKHGLNTIHDIWPGLQVYTPGGVAYAPYRHKFEEVFGREVIIMDTYLASEGFFAYTARPGTLNMRLATGQGTFFEFVPFDQRGFDEQAELLDDPVIHTLNEVEEGQEYALIITTVAGTYRYLIGDTITFTSLKHTEIKISGRTKHFLNVVGSQLTEARMNECIQMLQQEQQLMVKEFSLAAVEGEKDKWYHQWVLGYDGPEPPAEETIASAIDAFLSERHKNYEVARRKSLAGVKVRLVPAERFYDYQARERAIGGQVKTRKVISQEAMRAFLAFMDKQ